MLNLDASLELRGITLFRDFNVTNRYYYMPNSPRLSREAGQPMFQLLIYREDIAEMAEFSAADRDGGGFLTMTVDLGVSQAALDAVRGELESRAGGSVDLVPVPFHRGKVRVTALGASAGAAPGLSDAAEGEEAEPARKAGFVEQILGSSIPSLYGDNKAVFSFELSKRGALLMRASLEDGGASQIAVVYNLDYRGLLPARECTIEIDTSRVYQHLRTRAQVNTLWFKSDIDIEMERLITNHAIRITDVDYLGLNPEQQADRTQKLNELARQLATFTFFQPGLRPGQVLAQDRGNLTVYDATEDAKANTAGFTTSLAAAATGTGNTGDTPGPRLPGTSATTTTTRISGDPPPTRTESGTTTPGNTPATTTPPASSDPNTRLSAVERWNQAGRPQAAFLLRSLSQEEQQHLSYNLRQVSAQERTAAPQSSIRFASGDANLAGRVKVVDLNDPFFDVIQGSVSSTADFAIAGIRSLTVQVRYGVRPDGTGPKDSKEFQLTAPGQGGTFQFHLDHRHELELEYRVTAAYKAGFAIGDDTDHASSDWIRTSGRNLDVDPREVGAVFPINLTAGQVDWNAVKSIQTTVEYLDAASGINATQTVVTTQDAQTHTVHVRPKDPKQRQFRVASTYFYENHQEGPVLQTGRDASLVVLNQPQTKAVTVSLNLADAMGRIRKASVELAYAPPAGPEQQSLVELAGEGATTTWTLFRPTLDADSRYRYRVTLFGTDGTTRRSDWQTSAERSLVVGDESAAIHSVAVMVMAENLQALGFVAMKLRLAYPDAPEWADNDKEFLFRGTPDPVTWRVPMRAGGGKAYEYTAQWFRANQTIVTDGPRSVEDEMLILLPPAE